MCQELFIHDLTESCELGLTVDETELDPLPTASEWQSLDPNSSLSESRVIYHYIIPPL